MRPDDASRLTRAQSTARLCLVIGKVEPGRLELALGPALRPLEVPRNPQAMVLLSAGGLLALSVILAIAWDPQAVAQSLFDLLRL